MLISISFNLLSGTVIAQWVEKNNGLYCGENVRALAVSGTNLFAGPAGPGNGLFLSNNNGSSWTSVTELANVHVRSLVVSGNNVFAGGSSLDPGLDLGLYVSTDNGTSWVNRPIPLGYNEHGSEVVALAVSGTNLFAGTSYDGVFFSADNGINWKAVNTGFPSADTYILKALAVSGTRLYAGTYYTGVFVSSDNGNNWTAVNTGLTETNVLSLAFSGDTLFAGTYGAGVFKSSDGMNWTAVNAGLSNSHINAIAVSGANLFAGSNQGVFISADYGASWTAVNNGLTNTSVNALAASGTNLFAATGAGVFLSEDNGISWKAVNAGLPVRLPLVSSFAVSGTNLFVGTKGDGVSVSTNNGESWATINSGLTNTYVNALAVSGTNLFAGTQGGGIFLSTDNANHWTTVNNGLRIPYIVKLFAIDTTIYAGDTGGIFMSSNNGTSWVESNNGIPVVGIVVDFAAIGSDLFVCISYQTSGAGVWHSVDRGASWTATNLPQIAGISWVPMFSLAASGQKLFAGVLQTDLGKSPGGLFVSEDNGESWRNILPGTDIRNVFGSGSLIAANGLGNFISTDGGTSWATTYRGGSAYLVNGTDLFAGGAGVWSISIPLLPPGVIPITEVSTPNPKSMFVIYPNPAINDLTMSLAGFDPNSEVEIVIYDALGRTIERTFRSAEIATVSVGSYPSGTYIIKASQQNQIYRARFVKE